MHHPITVTVSIVIAFCAYFFAGVTFPDISSGGQATLVVLSLILFVASARRGWYQFFIVTLASWSTSVALGASFGDSFPNATGPFTTSIVLSPWIIFALAGSVACLLWLWYERSTSTNRFPVILLTLFMFNWIILAFNVKYFDDWKLENYLTMPFIVLVYVLHRWFRFSNISYGLMFAFMMLHIYGSHYTYAEVPFGFWLQNILEMSRNHYDRIVHFSFGFFFAYPMREVVLRVTEAKGFWGLYIPIEFVLAFSAIYEIIEWIVAIVFGGDLGIAYLGTQGDEWDAIKDMAVAGGGAVITMLVVLVILCAYRRREFFREFIESFHVRGKDVLGEEALQKLKS